MTTAAAVIGALAGLAFLGFAGLLVHADRTIKATPARLAAMACPRCGAVIGLDAATRIAMQRAEELQRRHQDARDRGFILRIAPYWWFNCPACGTALMFDPDARERQLTVAGATSQTSGRPARP